MYCAPGYPPELVCLGHHNRLGGIAETCCLTGLEARSPNSKVLSELVSSKASLESWLTDGCLSAVFSHGLPLVYAGREGVLWCLFLFLSGHQSYWIRVPLL